MADVVVLGGGETKLPTLASRESGYAGRGQSANQEEPHWNPILAIEAMIGREGGGENPH